MEHYVGLDVGLEETRICVVDRDGNSVRETKVPTEPEAIRSALKDFADRLGRVGVEASSQRQGTVGQFRPLLPTNQ